MENNLYDDLIDSIVEELSNSKLDLREFVSQTLEKEQMIKELQKEIHFLKEDK